MLPMGTKCGCSEAQSCFRHVSAVVLNVCTVVLCLSRSSPPEVTRAVSVFDVEKSIDTAWSRFHVRRADMREWTKELTQCSGQLRMIFTTATVLLVGQLKISPHQLVGGHVFCAHALLPQGNDASHIQPRLALPVNDVTRRFKSSLAWDFARPTRDTLHPWTDLPGRHFPLYQASFTIRSL